MIRWTFFFEQGSIKSEVTETDEDERIASDLQHFATGFLKLHGDVTDIYVNLHLVKCVARQELTQDQLDQELKAQEAQNVQTTAPQPTP